MFEMRGVLWMTLRDKPRARGCLWPRWHDDFHQSGRMRIKQHSNAGGRASGSIIRDNVGSCHLDMSFGCSREPSLSTPWGKLGSRELDVIHGRSRRNGGGNKDKVLKPLSLEGVRGWHER